MKATATYLLVDDGAETSLALHNGVWDTHLAAECWKEDDQLDWVDVVWNEDQSWLLGLNESNNMVQAVFDVDVVEGKRHTGGPELVQQ